MTGTEDRPGTIRIEQRTDIGLYDWNRREPWGYATGIEDRHGAIRFEQGTDMGAK